jgi:hypothetical protein
MDLNWVPGLVIVLLMLWFVFAWLSLISKDKPYDEKGHSRCHPHRLTDRQSLPRGRPCRRAPSESRS